MYTNWNKCYLCGFDLKAGHTLSTCPGHWHKPTHAKAFMRAKAQQYINQEYDACSKGM